MATFVLRLWLPDRPGALGAVASRVGAVGGDVVGIEILERGAGKAVDELVVALADSSLRDLLLSEIDQVDGVAIEEIREVAGSVHDPRLDALETAAVLVGAATPADALDALAEHARTSLGAHWSAVVRIDDAEVAASRGNPPSASWLAAFVVGSQSAARAAEGAGQADDVVWAPLPSARAALVLGREELPFRVRERRQATALARIVDTRFGELSRLGGRSAHPTGSTD